MMADENYIKSYQYKIYKKSTDALVKDSGEVEATVDPMYLFDKKYIAEKIREEYDGSNGKELAKKYGYSERHIREIAKK